MKTQSVIGYTLLLVFICYLTLQIVANALTGRGLYMPNITNPIHNNAVSTVGNASVCSSQPATPSLSSAKDKHLQKLAKYETLCRSKVTDTYMIFTDMPKDNEDAKNKATTMAATLKEFHYYNIKPLVVVEPVTSWGTIDFNEFKTGFYDEWISAYFKYLSNAGITTDQMGMWVPFPEANLPYWNHVNASPSDFAIIVNKYLAIANGYFPKLQGSVLLNSATYENDDFDWANGEYISLLPYVEGLDTSLVHSFGLQGLPWTPPANGSGAGIFDASEFLNHNLASEAADALGTKKIWFNTGTFQTKYYGDPERQSTIQPEQRADILAGIITQAQLLQKKEYDISINLFAQNKNNTNEATDWSYFTNETIETSPHSPVFINFAQRLQKEGIQLWLFDTDI